jgi:hypothetical protein
MKLIILLVSLFTFISCNNKVQNSDVNSKSFEDNLKIVVKTFFDSTRCINEKKLFHVRYQKFGNLEYIQLGNSPFYSDSLFCGLVYADKFIGIYNKEFFENRILTNILKEKFIPLVRDQFDYGQLDGGCFEIYQIIGNRFLKIEHDSFVYNNAFSKPPLAVKPSQ